MMAVIGSFGPLVFEVSDKQIKTFQNLTRDNNERWHDHELDGLKPLAEYIGPGLDEISFDIEFSAFLGVNPLEEMDKLVRMSRAGETHRLVIGSKVFGYHRWRIANVSQKVEEVDQRGNILLIETHIKLVEHRW